MASKHAYALRAVNARERVYAGLRALFPEATMPQIPQFSKFGQDHLHAQQWEVLADWFDGHVGDNESDEELNSYDSLTRAELEALVADRGLVDKVIPTGAAGKAVKSDYLQALLDADAEEPDEPENEPEPEAEPESHSWTFKGEAPPVMFGDEGTDNDADGGTTRED